MVVESFDFRDFAKLEHSLICRIANLRLENSAELERWPICWITKVISVGKKREAG
jgi:hypothetical protein